MDKPTSVTSDLAQFFRPRSVALVGASDKSGWSTLIHSRFARFGHEGELFAVNRKGSMAHGLPGFTSCTEIGVPIDMAYIYVPAAAVIEALEDAAKAGIRNAVILTSGFADAGEEGAAMQQELADAAERLGIRFMGPNSMGFANIAHRSCVTSINTREPVRTGGLALVSQSGAVANELGKYAHIQGIGLAFTAATGNEAGLSITDIVEYLVEDEEVRAIGLYVESLRNPERFMEVAARAMDLRKPIVLLKLGRSSISGAIAMAHTGSLIGNDAVFDAMCERYAVTRANSVEELISTADFLGRVGPIDPPRIGFASLSGGACAMYADLADLNGVDVKPFAPQTQRALAEVLPPFAATLNPLDVTGVVVQDPQIWSRVIPVMAQDPGKGLTVVSTVLPNTEWEIQILGDGIKAVTDGFRTAGKPSVLINIIQQEAGPIQLAFREEAGIDVVLPSLDVGTRALAHLQRWSERLSKRHGAVMAPAGLADRIEGERATLEFLSDHGVPVIPSKLATDAEQARKAVAEMGVPCALKIASPDIAHKTEAGGVRLGVSEAEAAQTFESIVASAKRHTPGARIDGVLVSPMRSGGTELLISVVNDPEWGLALTVGIGGVLTEVLKDTVVRLLPVGSDEIKDMLLALRGAKLLQGYRGQPAADMDKLAGAIAGIAGAAAALGSDFAALEVNPLRVNGMEIEALDGLTIYRD